MRQANAKEKSFMTKSYVLFATLLLIVIAVLMLVQIYEYRNGAGLFSSLVIGCNRSLM